MRKLGAVVGVAVLGVALAGWMRPTVPGAQGGGTISGKVKFTGAKPAMPKIDMSEEPKCKAKYTAAPPTEETVVVNANGTLADVFVYVKSGLPASYKAPARRAGDPRPGRLPLPSARARYPGRPGAHHQELRRHPAQHQGEGHQEPPVQHQPAERDEFGSDVHGAGGDGAARVQRARLDARVAGRAAAPVLLGHGDGRRVYDQGTPARHVHGRGLAGEIRHADRDGDGGGERDEDGGFQLRRQVN